MRQEWVGKRKSVRQNCLIRAEIRTAGDGPSLDCTITEISATGARIESEHLDGVPDVFDLFIPARGETKSARVVRREPTFLGVTFVAARSDESQVVADLMKRLAAVERMTAAAAAPLPDRDERTTALEGRIQQLEAEVARVRALAETAADRPAPPDRIAEVQSLREALSALADRLERTAIASESMPEPDPRLAELATDVADLRRAIQISSTATADRDGLADEVTALRQSVQSLILLVSQLVARGRSAA